MRNTSFAGAALAALLAVSSGAEAAPVIYTYSGIVDDWSDRTGVFGQVGTNLPSVSFTAHFIRDDDTPGAEVVEYGHYTEIGGPIGVTPVHGDLTINGATFTFDPLISFQDQASFAECLSCPLVTWEHKVVDRRTSLAGGGTILFDNSTLDMFGSYARVSTPLVSGPDYHTLPTVFAPDALMTGSFSISRSVQDVISHHYFSHSLAWGDLIATSMTVTTESPPTSGAPEPAGWALMLLGVGGIGAALRRTRRGRAVPSA